MIDRFVEVSTAQFHLEIWPAIKEIVEAIGYAKNANPYPLLIKWGTIDKVTKVPTVLAASLSDGTWPDRHWVTPHLLKPSGFP